MLARLRRLGLELLEDRRLLSADPFPVPSQAVEPLGSLIWDSSVSGRIASSGEIDGFTIDLDGGQTVTVVADPHATLRPGIELFDPHDQSLGSVTAGAAGQDAVLQVVPITDGGTYTLAVSGAANTAGAYTAQLILNAAAEKEKHDGPTNDAPGSAQDLDAAFLALGGVLSEGHGTCRSDGQGERGAVLGSVGGGRMTVIDSEDFESGLLDHQWTTFSSLPEGRIRATDERTPAGGRFALLMDVSRNDVGFNLNEAVWTVDLSGVTAPKLRFSNARFWDDLHPLPVDFTGSVEGDGVAISNNGMRWHTIFTPPQQPSSEWATYTIDLTTEAAAAGMVLGADFRIKFQQYDDEPVSRDGRHFDEIMIFTVEPTEDWYRFTLDDGQSATLALAMQPSSDVSIELYDSGLNLLSVGAAGANADWMIDDLVDLTADASPETYYVRLACEFGGDYSLVVTRQAGFEVEPNNGLAADAQEVSPGGVLLGHAGFSSGEPIPEEKLAALDAEMNDEFGFAVSIRGDTAIVGAPGEGGRLGAGAAYFLRFDGSRWVQQQKYGFQPSMDTHGFEVGKSVCIDGEVAIVGAPAGVNPYTPGVAHVFRFDGTEWIQEQHLTAPEIDNDEQFGWSVSISGDRAIVGSVTNYGSDSGGAYVFRYDGAQWVFEQELLVPDLDERDFYGHAVCIQGNTAVVGAPGFLWRHNNALWSGAVHVFQYDGTQWVRQQTLLRGDVPEDGSFGSSVSLDGETLVVGACEDRDDAGRRRGSAVVYRFDGGQWVRQQKLRASETEHGRWFGRRVQIDGHRIIIGDPTLDEPGNDAGAAYLFEFDGQQWRERLRLRASAAAYGDYFGSGVAISGQTVIIGAPESNVFRVSEDEIARPGSAYVFSFPTPHDDYAINVRAGDGLTVETTTPADGPGEFVNRLDPRVELYDPAGLLVAEDDDGAPDGHNALLEHPATQTGSYTVRVLRGGEAEGEYLLNVTGNTGALHVFLVSGTDPADGQRLPAAPSRITVELNDAVLLTTLDAPDLTVDGVAATSVTLADADTAIFHLPPLDEGTHEVVIAGGAMLDLSGTPIEPFHCQFVVDLTPPRVVESSMLEGQIVPAGTLVYTARLDEQLCADALDADAVELVGPITGAHQPGALDYNTTTSTLRLEFADVLEDMYTLRLRSGDGHFEDLAGNDLDGEPHPLTTVPSGDGVPGGDFLVHFTVDVDTLAYPGLLVRQDPRGSLISAGSAGAVIDRGGDVDNFTIELAAGQTITAVVDPQATLQPSVELFDAGGHSLGTAAAGAAGEDAVLQTAAVTAAGTYTVSASGQPGTTGIYVLQLVLGAAVQPPCHDGPPNDSPQSAQDLQPTFIALADGLARRGAVLGRRDFTTGEIIDGEDFESGTLGARWTTYSSLAGGRIRVTDEYDAGGGSFAMLMDHGAYGAECNLNEAIWTVDLSGRSEVLLSFLHGDWLDERNLFDGEFNDHFNADGVAISDDGVRWHPVWQPPFDQPFSSWAPYVIDLAAEARTAGMTLGPGFRIKFQQYDNLAMGYLDPDRADYSKDGRGYDEITLSVPIPLEGDWYRFLLDDGQAATAALTATEPGSLRLELYDGTQTLRATGTTAGNLDQVIHHFVDPTADAQADVYYLRVAGTGGDYSLVVTQDAAFDAEPNSAPEDAQELSPASAAMGYLVYPLPSPTPPAPYTDRLGGGNLSADVVGVQASACSSDFRVQPKGMQPEGWTPTRAMRFSGDEPYVPGRLIVRFADPKTDPATAEVVQAKGAKVIRRLPLIDGALIELSDQKADVLRAAAEWSAHPSVLYAEPDYLDTLDTVPNDPRFSELWGLHNTGQAGPGPNWGLHETYQTERMPYGDVDAPEAWDVSTGSSDVVVAVVDTGVDYTHEDLAANMWVNPGEIPGDGIDNDGNGYVDDIHGINADGNDSDPMDVLDHGTHVAGIIGAVGSNGIGVTGVNWNVRIMALRAGDSGGISVSSQIACLDYMTMMKTDYGINVVASNNSYGGTSASQARKDAIQASNNAGILFVASAGNSSADNELGPHYPSNYDLDGIIAVAATDQTDQRTAWSNYGRTSVDLAAPGFGILSTVPGNGYELKDGTSMAAPYVTGAVAMVAAQYPEASPAEIKALLLRGADPVPDFWDCTVSGGRLSLANALAGSVGKRGDYYRVHVNAGDRLLIGTRTPDGGSAAPENPLDPALELYDPSGVLVAADDNSAPDGRNAQLAFQTETGGQYTLWVVSMAGHGEYVVTVLPHEPRVADRHVFYNRSAFDGELPSGGDADALPNGRAANAQDDLAIAPDKEALLPGQTASFANYTSYSLGINGIMIDVANLPDGITLDGSDFQFRVGNDSDPGSWATGPAPSSVGLRRGDGRYGSDRITITWPDNTIQKQWLQVTVPAGGDVGLLQPDVFYFGNAIGESGNSTSDAKVNAYDMLAARDNQRTFVSPAAIDFDYDYNRDARVNAYDMLIARDNQTHFLNALKLITAPGSTGPESPIARSPGQDLFWLGWLWESDDFSGRRHRSGKAGSAEQAIDRLLAAGWQ